MRILLVVSALLSAAACVAQAPQPQVVPLRIGGVDVVFGLEADEVGVVPPAEGAAAYVQAVLGKGMCFSQCFFVLDGAYRKKLLSGRPTSEAEDRQGLHSMIVVTTQPCDVAFIRTSRDASVASTKDKGALAAHFKEFQAQAVKDGGATIKPLNVSPEQAAKQVGQAGLISESARHFTVGIGADNGVIISSFVCAESRLVVFAQWTDAKNFPHCIERAKAFSDDVCAQTKAVK
jgi:hypothetical protein